MSFGHKRTDIQVLRAFAVLVVIIFHLNEKWLPNGYLGVDVFFVISGYVITRSIWGRHISGVSFNVHTFFARRIARLLPALLFTIVFTFALGFLLYSAEDYSNLASSAIYSIGGVSNIYFFTQTNYFSAPLESMPLLHTWSLSVEEQFYILFALISTLLTLLGVNFIRWSMFIWGGLIVVSLYFIFSDLGWVNNISTIRQLALDDAVSAFKFYLLPSRVYQLSLGVMGACLIAKYGHLPFGEFLRKLLWGIGFILISFVVFVIDVSSMPELVALIVSLLVFLVLLVGESEKDVLQHIFLRPLVKIGDRSYSLYLVHWPLVVFVSYYMVGLAKPYMITISIIAIVLVGEISFQIFEKRKWFTAGHASGISAVFVYILLFIFSMLFFVVHNEGLKFRIESKETDRFYQYQSDAVHATRKDLPKVVGNGKWVNYIRFSPINKPITERVLVLGDSHAGHLAEMAKYYAATRGHSWTIYNFTGCPPIFGYYKVYGITHAKESDKQKACRRQVGLWKDYITKYASNYDVIVLSARWNWMFEHTLFNNKKIRRDSLVKIGSKEVASLEQSRANFVDGLKDTVNYIQSIGLRVVVLGQPPLSTVRLQACDNIPKYILNNKMVNARCNPDPYDEVIRRSHFVDAVLRNPESFGMSRFDTLVATDVFCKHEKEVCNRIYYGKTMFNDDSHYNKFGALYLAKTWEKSDSFPFK